MMFREPTSALNFILYLYAVVRSSVPRMNLDNVFEQKNEIAKSVESELEKVCTHAVVTRMRLHR